MPENHFCASVRRSIDGREPLRDADRVTELSTVTADKSRMRAVPLAMAASTTSDAEIAMAENYTADSVPRFRQCVSRMSKKTP